MTERDRPLGIVGLLEDPEALVRAARKVRDAGWRRWDCHTPHPVHGLETAMGIKGSVIPYIAIVAALFGAAFGKAMQWWMSAWDFPLIIGGTPLFAIPAFAPVAFETFVLFAALATFAALLVLCRLLRWHSPLHDARVMHRVTSDRYAIFLDASDKRFSEPEGRRLLAECGCSEIYVAHCADERETAPRGD